MDKIKNPFSPGAGSPPPELAGRDAILEQARFLLGRIREKRPEKSILMTGGAAQVKPCSSLRWNAAVREAYRRMVI
jgi:hypothetical protein